MLPTSKKFEWLALDFLIDQKFDLYLIDVNQKPGVSSNTNLWSTRVFAPKFYNSLINIVLAYIANRDINTLAQQDGFIPLMRLL